MQSMNLELLTDIDILLMVAQGIRGGICEAIYRYAKASNKFVNSSDKRKKYYIFFIQDHTICTCKKCLKNTWKWF